MASTDSLAQEYVQLFNREISSGIVTICSETEDANYCNLISENFALPFPNRNALLFEEDKNFSEAECVERALSIFDEVEQVAGLEENQKLIIAKDEESYPMLIIPLGILRKNLAEIISFPHHTYIVPVDCAWCLCYRMEGDIGFKFAQ